jgi:hypothetical protein
MSMNHEQPAAGVTTPATIDDYDYESDPSYQPLDREPETDPSTEPAAPPAETPPSAASAQEVLIERFGLNEGTIEFDGAQVAFADLSAEDQADVLAQIAEANAAPTQPKLSAEIEILNELLSKGMSIEEIASELAGNKVASLSDDQLNMQQIAQQHPELTADELQAELDWLKQNPNYQSKTNALRKRLEATGNSTLEQIREARVAAHNAEVQADIEHIRSAVATIQDVDGYDVDPNVHARIMADLTELDAHGNSAFINDLEDPTRMYKARYYELMMPVINNYWQQQVKQAEDRGYQRALGKMPSQPAQPDTGSTARRQAAPAGKPAATTPNQNGYDPMMNIEDTLG